MQERSFNTLDVELGTLISWFQYNSTRIQLHNKTVTVTERSVLAIHDLGVENCAYDQM